MTAPQAQPAAKFPPRRRGCTIVSAGCILLGRALSSFLIPFYCAEHGNTESIVIAREHQRYHSLRNVIAGGRLPENSNVDKSVERQHASLSFSFSCSLFSSSRSTRHVSGKIRPAEEVRYWLQEFTNWLIEWDNPSFASSVLQCTLTIERKCRYGLNYFTSS